MTFKAGVACGLLCTVFRRIKPDGGGNTAGLGRGLGIKT